MGNVGMKARFGDRISKYNHPPMDRLEKTLVWIVAICFCVSIWVHVVLPGIDRLAKWAVSLF